MVRARRSPVPDGRQNNGGARQGTPGTPYGQRSDLRTQKITVAPGQPYGQAGAQRAAQQAVPMAGAPAAPPSGGAPQPGPMPTGPANAPLDAFAPTDRPSEPVTHGLPTGPGAGPEALQITGAANPAMTDPVAIAMRALYQRYLQGPQSSPAVAADLAAALGEIR